MSPVETELIAQALAAATDTREVVVDRGAVEQVGAVFARLFPGRTAVVVGDPNTLAAAGEATSASLAAAGVQVEAVHTLGDETELYADYDNCALVRDMLADSPAIAVAVGSGTLNDVVKRAMGELERGYMVLGTAASMDGYTAFGSSITKAGYKQTMGCPAPVACLIDLDVASAAPPELNASGFGDLIGKIPAGADWIIADALGVEPIDRGVWDQVQGPLRGALGDPAGVAAGRVSAIRPLAEGLVMSGLAMQAHQSSRPASGAEHQFSHLWEMEGHGMDWTPRRLSHGFKVGIGTVAITALYEALLARDLTQLDVDAAVAAWPDAAEQEARVLGLHPGSHLAPEAVRQTMPKQVSREQLADRLNLVREIWPRLRKQVAAQLAPAADIADWLAAAGAPSHPGQIRIDWDRFRHTYTRAQTIRKRYTVLDLVFEAGLADELVDELFSSDGFWGARR